MVLEVLVPVLSVLDAVIAPPAGLCCEDSLVRLRQCHYAAIKLS